MSEHRVIALAILAALGFGTIAPAQERGRDRRDRDRDRDGQSSSATTQPAPSGYNERYAILEQRNVFVRDRSRATSRPASSGSSSSTQPTRRTIEESLVVRGIAMEEYGYRAYVEDLNTGTTLRLSPGDNLGRGQVSAVALDAIAYEHEGKKTWIDIGSDLTGKTSIASASPYASSATTSPTTLPANINLNDPSLTVEQRMRLRVQLQNQQRAQ